MNKKIYEDWSKDDLISEIKKLRKRKKYGLVWENKEEDVVEQCKKNLPVLEEINNKEIKSDNNGNYNIIIEGDNYHSLSVLNYIYNEKIDVIYIDPPYNTGARDWKYNNNYVDQEDPYRHTKWISFMYHRLKICKNLLSKDGIICVTIDDHEFARLWCLLEEIFKEKNFLGSIVIRINPGGRKSKRKIAAQHEYALYFSKNSGTQVSQFFMKPEEKSHRYKKGNKGEWYEERNLRKEGADSLAKPTSERFYPIYFDPKTKKISSKVKYKIEILPIDTNGQKRIWRRSKNDIDLMSKNGEIFLKRTKSGPQVYFKFKGGLKGETPKSFWSDVKYSASEHGTRILDNILGTRETFPFPKSPYATADCIKVANSKKDALILDFFAGSGTTGQSVLELNKQDNGERKFILCTNNENNIAEKVCYPRIMKVIKGYKVNNKKVKGLGGNVKYFKTSFVPSDYSDKNKILLTKKATDMICIKENTFENIINKNKYKIFKNNNNFTFIIYDQLVLDEIKKIIPKYKGNIKLYIFSLGNDLFEEEFDKFINVSTEPIPESILAIYRRLFI